MTWMMAAQKEPPPPRRDRSPAERPAARGPGRSRRHKVLPRTTAARRPRAAATVNVYDEGDGGALHRREGANEVSVPVAPFLAVASGMPPSTRPPPA